MSDIGWQPDELDVKRSVVESKVADIIEDDSLKVIVDMAGTEDVDPADAADHRAGDGADDLLRLALSRLGQGDLRSRLEPLAAARGGDLVGAAEC